jgi:hypothetical protein
MQVMRLVRVKYLPLFAVSFLFSTACGDNNADSRSPDASPATPDAVAPVDPPACDVANYPAPIERISVDLQHEFDLALDGVGARCDQIIRALTSSDPALRPTELAQLDVEGVTGNCQTDTELGIEVIRLQAPRYAGKPLYGTAVQDVLVHLGRPTQGLIGMPAHVVYLHGDFFAAGATTNTACMDGEAVNASIAGRDMTYGRFNGCIYQSDGAYAIAADDTVEVGDEGYFVDANGKLHRARAVDVYLQPAHLNDDIANSDAYCCNGTTLDHCVGQKLFIDVVTGEVLGQAQHCLPC